MNLDLLHDKYIINNEVYQKKFQSQPADGFIIQFLVIDVSKVIIISSIIVVLRGTICFQILKYGVDLSARMAAARKPEAYIHSL